METAVRNQSRLAPLWFVAFVLLGVATFSASAGWTRHTVSQLTSAAAGVAMIAGGMAPALREVWPRAPYWSLRTTTFALAVTLGLLARTVLL